MKALAIFALIFSVWGCFAFFGAGIFFSAISGVIAIWVCKKHCHYALVPLIINVVNLLILSPQKLPPELGGIMNIINTIPSFFYSFILPSLLIQIFGLLFYMKNLRGKQSGHNIEDHKI